MPWRTLFTVLDTKRMTLVSMRVFIAYVYDQRLEHVFGMVLATCIIEISIFHSVPQFTIGWCFSWFPYTNSSYAKAGDTCKLFYQLSLLESTGQKSKQIEKRQKQFSYPTPFYRSITALPTSDLPPPNLPRRNEGDENDEDENSERTDSPGNIANQGRCHRPDNQTVEARLETFRNWPSGSTQSPEHLAIAGFYYTGYADEVRCFHCGIVLKQWSLGDKAWVEHCRWSPNCRFVRDAMGAQFITRVGFEDDRAFTTCDEKPSILIRSVRQRIDNILGEYQQLIRLLNTHSAMNKRLKKRIFCHRCKNNEKRVTFLPCGHLLFCIACAQGIRNCPACGKTILWHIRTYMP